MDPETLALVRQLCTRVGTVMEDASVVALVWNKDELSVGSRLEQLERVVLQLSTLISAAKAIASAED